MFDDPIVTVPSRSLRRFGSVVKRREGAIGKAFVQWSRIFGAFIRKRFIKFSRGGGNWRRLSQRTIDARRRGSGRGRGPAILYNTGMLYASLNPEILLLRQTTGGLTATFGGPGKYPDGASVADVMSWHNSGAGNLPKRQILVGPDVATQREMRRVMDRAVEIEAKKS